MNTLGIFLNTQIFAFAQQMGLNFNSICSFNEKIVGANEFGIFEFGADDDNGTAITAFFQIASSDLGETKQKRISKASMAGYWSDGGMKVSVIYDDQLSSAHSLPPMDTEDQNVLEFDINTLDTGRFIGVRVDNIDGSDFSVNAIDIEIFLTVVAPSTKNVSGRLKEEGLDFDVSATGTV
jgi:hypothetical protein